AYYWFASPYMVEHIMQRDTGSTIPLINLSVLRSLPIPLPPVDTQAGIVEVLASLDDKIYLLHRQNQTLEQMAEALYRQWFIEEAEGWDLVTLGDLCCTITKGTTPSTMGKAFVDSGVNFFKAESLTDHGSINRGKLAKIDTETHGMLKRSQLQHGDVLLTIAGTIGRTAVVTADVLPANTNQAVAILRPDTTKISTTFLRYTLVRADVRDDMLSKVVHAVQPNLSLGEIGRTSLLLPPKTKLEMFDRCVGGLAEKISQNEKQIASLQQTRDTLLPKLLSGEVIISQPSKAFFLCYLD
ncbi:restriction endonuclease subunit S, partial [archaeon]